jgi:acyl-lipid omega-6 desaturase (Delta-12 desaturase)
MTSDISQLKARDDKAFLSLLVPLILCTSGVYLSLGHSVVLHWAGQFILSLFFLQTFILLHECGHLNFFKTRFLNVCFGHIFGFLSIIPFYSWTHMHNLHHKWTGWRDLDPTTEKTVELQGANTMRWIVNISWFLFIPIFFLSYMLSNYWNIFKIKRHLNERKFRVAVLQIGISLLIYIVLFLSFKTFLLQLILPAFLMSLVWKELVIMTQHSHIETPIANDSHVKPVSYADQVKYTRSFYVNSWFESLFLFNFNYHETHHVYPGVPAYWLQKIDLNVPKEPSYKTWFIKAKSMKGEDYVFRTSAKTGKKF